MNWLCASPINAFFQGAEVPDTLRGQGGGFSPLLFGMLLGMVLFSGVSAQFAKHELERYRVYQAQRAKAQAEELAKGLEFSVLTENRNTYSDSYGVDRGKAYSNTYAKTRGKQDFLVNVQADDREQGRFGQNRTTMAIAATDDTLLRGQVYRAESAREIQEISSTHEVALLDISAVRERQVRDSGARMELMAEQVYGFFAAHKKFPTMDEFVSLSGRVGIHDVWGQVFDYAVETDGSKAALSFTTPWNYTQSLKLSLKDEMTEAQ